MTIDITLMTGSGPLCPPALQGVVIPAGTRATFDPGLYVTTFDLSAVVEGSGGIICEQAMYGNGRTWAHDSIGFAP